MSGSRAAVSYIKYLHTQYSFRVMQDKEWEKMKKEEQQKMSKIEIFTLGYFKAEKS